MSWAWFWSRPKPVSAAGCWRAAGPGRRVPCQGRAGLDGTPCPAVQDPSRGCKRLPRGGPEGGNTRQPPEGSGAEPRAGSGTAAGRRAAAGGELFSARPRESPISRPPFGEAFPGKRPGPRSSPGGAARGGRAGRACPPRRSRSPFLSTRRVLAGEPQHPPVLPPRFY